MSLAPPLSADPTAIETPRPISPVAPELKSSSTHDSGIAPHFDSQKPLTRHFTSLQEHADHVVAANAQVAKNGDLTPRNDNRREGFTWDARQDVADIPRRASIYSALPPEQLHDDSPPPLEEILRRTSTNGTADSMHNDWLRQMEGTELRASKTDQSISSVASEPYLRIDGRRSSIVALAKTLTGLGPDTKDGTRSEKGSRGRSEPQRQDSFDAVDRKKDRKIAFAPLPTLPSRQSVEEATQQPANVERIALKHQSSVTESEDGSAKSGLRERRKVKMDLSIPLAMVNLPARNRSPVTTWDGLSPSRRRSPQTPWTQSEQPSWEPANLRKTTPIVEEEYIRASIANPGGTVPGGLGLLLGSDKMGSSESPKFERPSQKVRDRCYITRPRFQKRTRSARSGTSDSTLAQTPDGNQTWSDPALATADAARMNKVSRQVDSAIKPTHSRRWGWKMKSSSDDIPQSSEPSTRRFSINPFRRSNRISDQLDSREKKPANYSKANKSNTSQHDPALSHINVPPAFIPPGVHRVPTPPLPDAQGEVRGKLADFFFDVQSSTASPSRRQRQKPSSPGGYWDSDALLMSLDKDMANDDDEEEEEEGPEGPSQQHIKTKHTPLQEYDFSGTPGLVVTPGSYLNAKPNPKSPGQTQNQPTNPLDSESWFRIRHTTFSEPRDERTLSTLARQEQEERRKFEWLVPEHLPNSPLCPLHVNYRGSSKGLCHWHGRMSVGGKTRKGGEYGAGWGNGGRGNGDGASVGAGKVVATRVRMVESPGREVRKRRLVSLSGP